MSLLAHLDPGPAVTRAILSAAAGSSVVILMAGLLARAVFNRRAEARHALWFGVLVWVLLSPIAACVAERSGFALWFLPLPLPEPTIRAAVEEAVAAVVVDRDLGPGGGAAPGVIAGDAGSDAEAGAARPVVEETPRSVPVIAHGAIPRGNRVAGGLALLWFAGMVVGLARMVVGWRRLAAIDRVTQLFDVERHAATLEKARAAMGVAVLPPIVTSAAARGPVAVGLLRPRVVLPDRLAESISSRSLCDVLVHESAHVLRGDAWVGLLQRVAGVLFWPHPFVHFANDQLARAREEVCDNHVLRCGDACGYARTLLALTNLCRPGVATRPAGLGLLAGRWTLTDRVAGLLDPRRVPMTNASLRMKTALAIALCVTGLSVASVRLAGSSQVAAEKGAPAEPQVAAPATPNADSWSVEGIVVDEQDRRVAGAVVRTMPILDRAAKIQHQTAADGTFRFTLQTPTGLVGLMAEADGGLRMGLDRSFDRRRAERSKEPARIMLKPSRAVTVRVKDAAGAPVPGATVEAAERQFRTHDTTGADGSATLRIPADAQVEWVVGFQPGAGFDYFENYDKRAFTENRPLPSEVNLTLLAAPPLRIKVVDSKGGPVAGLVIKPIHLYRTGKKDSVHARLCESVSAATDPQGVASFDWLPTGLGLTRFTIDRQAGYSCPDDLQYDPGGRAEITARVLRATRLGGTVRLPDGRPARQVLVRANGWGQETGGVQGMVTARTGNDGRYALDVPPERAYMVTVVDEAWAARSVANVVVREGRAQDGLDFELVKGTLLRGRITEGRDHRSSPGARVMLIEQGGVLPKDFRGVLGNKGQLMRGTTTTDAEGRYQFRVGPGRYTVQSANGLQVPETVSVEVKNEPEIDRDLTLKVSTPEPIFKGIVVEKTATGERPVAKARIMASPFGTSVAADEQGRFELERKPGAVVLYAYSEDKGLAGFITFSAGEDHGRVVISKAASVTGRVIDTQGKPRARSRVGVRLSPARDASSRFGFTIMCDEQGHFSLRWAPAGSEGELSAPHLKDANGRLTRARTVMPFDVDDLEPVEVPDLVVPAEKAAGR